MLATVDDIQATFESDLTIPERSPRVQSLLCPVGLVGAGKTTVVRPIASALGFVRVSSDELRKRLKENGHGYERLKELLFPVLNRLVLSGKSIALDMDCGNPQTVEWIQRAEKLYGLKVFWLRVDTPKEFIIKKFKAHPPSWLASDPQQMIDNYETQAARTDREPKGVEYFDTFDTSAETLPGDIDSVTKRLSTLVE